MPPSNDTRQRILESAQELLYSRSYADVGVAAICEAANVKKGSFYHFFPSKQNLTLAVLDEFVIVSKMEIMDRAFAKDIPPMQRILRMVDEAYRFQKEIADRTGHTLGCPFGNLALELSTQDEPIRQKIAGIFATIEAMFKLALDEALDNGDIKDVDTKATAAAMFAYMEGIMLMAKTNNDANIIKKLGPAVANIRL